MWKCAAGTQYKTYGEGQIVTFALKIPDSGHPHRYIFFSGAKIAQMKFDQNKKTKNIFYLKKSTTDDGDKFSWILCG